MLQTCLSKENDTIGAGVVVWPKKLAETKDSFTSPAKEMKLTSFDLATYAVLRHCSSN